MTIHTSVVADLRAQLNALLDDFRQWNQRAAPPDVRTRALGPDLPQHHSQIARITRQLEAALDVRRLRDQLASAGGDDLGSHRRPIEIVHLIWTFFRDKLMQRDTRRYQAHLGAGDDLAWACYQPFAEARAAVLGSSPAPVDLAQLKEPPLVFYSADRAPFARPRELPFHAPGLDADDTRLFAGALQRLPVPLIGISWPQTLRVAPLVLIAHEVGHVIARDLGIVGEAERRIAAIAIPEERRATWQAWLDEVVADVFGVILLGRSYVDQLQRAIAGTVAEVRGERIRPGSPGTHPTRALRIAVCHCALGALRLTADPIWEATYGAPDGDSAAHVDDVAPVVDAVVNHPYDALGQRLTDIVLWTGEDEARVDQLANDLINATASRVPFSVRTWVAAAARAHSRDAVTYASRGLDARLTAQIFGERSHGVRSAPRWTTFQAGNRIAELATADAIAGQRLASFLNFPPTEES